MILNRILKKLNFYFIFLIFYNFLTLFLYYQIANFYIFITHESIFEFQFKFLNSNILQHYFYI